MKAISINAYEIKNDDGETMVFMTPKEFNFIKKQNDLKNKEIERLTAESTKWESKFYDEAKKVDRAIEYIDKNSYTTIETIDDINYFIVRLDKCVDLLDILKGVDKE